VGITGTNGKTTTSILVDALLRTRGGPTGLIGTIEYRIGEERLPASQTTPDAYRDAKARLFRLLAAGAKARRTAVVNADDPAGVAMVAGLDLPTFTFGLGPAATIR